MFVVWFQCCLLALCRTSDREWKTSTVTLSAALRRLPRAFLWLSRVTVRTNSSIYAEANIVKQASAGGVHSSRLAFSWRFPEKDYVAFRALGDLVVDNMHYNAHTTGADAFWAGVPAVVLAAQSPRAQGPRCRSGASDDGRVTRSAAEALVRKALVRLAVGLHRPRAGQQHHRAHTGLRRARFSGAGAARTLSTRAPP